MLLQSLHGSGLSVAGGERVTVLGDQAGAGAAVDMAEVGFAGHFEVEPEWSEGRLTAASKDGVRRKAAANPRGMQGYAAGR